MQLHNKKFSTKQILENYVEPLLNQGYIDKAESVLDRRNKIYYPVVTSKIRKLFDSDQSIFLTENGKQRVLEETELKEKYPLSYQYLSQFRTHLVHLRQKFKTNPKYWYALHRGRQQAWFEQEKIITPEISLGSYDS